jgi:hypothetical protein
MSSDIDPSFEGIRLSALLNQLSALKTQPTGNPHFAIRILQTQLVDVCTEHQLLFKGKIMKIKNLQSQIEITLTEKEFHFLEVHRSFSWAAALWIICLELKSEALNVD